MKTPSRIQTIVHIALFVFPRLFGCRKVVLGEIRSERLFQALKGLNASPKWETFSPSGECSNYIFQLENKLIGFILEEWRPVKLIAPEFLIEKIRAALSLPGKENCGH